MRLRLSFSPKVLKLAVVAKRLSVAIGKFILSKFNVENISVSDSFSNQPEKSFSNSAIAQDISLVVPNKGIFNTVGLSDGEEYFEEDYVLGDYVLDTQITWVLNKNVLEVALVQDTLSSIQYSKLINENIKVIDFLDGELDKTDKTIDFFTATTNIPSVTDQFERQVAYVRSFAELTSIVDSAAISIGVSLANNSSALDSGFLRLQGYTEDMTYFAEDYVGESKTFT